MARDPARAGETPGDPQEPDTKIPLRTKLTAAGKGLMAKYPWVALVAWTLLFVYWVGILALAWVCYWVGIPEVWDWVKQDFWWRALPGLAAGFVLLLSPMWAGMSAVASTEILLDAALASQNAKLAQVRERVRDAEEDALHRLEATDQAGLLPLLRYSRAQLDAYYAMGLGQTRRAFLNAAIAMWLGFVLLLVGVAMYIAPVRQLGISPPPADFNWLILSSAVIIEVISALFLWVYRSTIGQLTFYYRLQMQSHTAILCFRIANTMKDADQAKRAVIDKLLAATPDPERPAAPSGKNLAALVQSVPAP